MRLSPLLALLVSPFIVRADEPAIIAKARAYLGSEEALSGVQSVHLVGSFVAGSVGAPAPVTASTPGTATTPPIVNLSPSTSSVDIIFQKPYQHHLVVTAIQSVPQTGLTTDDQKAGIAPGSGHTSRVIRTIALNSYDAWEKVEVNDAAPQLGLLGKDQIRVLRADVWENLGYYRGIEAEGGRVEDQGPVTQDGVACEKVAFIHSPSVIYYRYFDRDTGRLVFTQTVGGLKIREEGMVVVSGIKFPQKIVTVEPTSAANPTPRTTTLTIDSVTVNEVFPTSEFSVPLPPLPARDLVPVSSSIPSEIHFGGATPAGSGATPAPSSP
jgi:hypothetical protein